MIPKAFAGYDGGKGGNGTYHTIINHIPPHDEFYSLFLGNCAITQNIKPAKLNVLNDIDPDVINAWLRLDLPENYILNCAPALDCLSMLAKNCDAAAKRFIYLDPPYRFEARKNKNPLYRYEMSENDHIALLSQIVAMNDHNIMISHYPDPVYNEILHNWNFSDFESMTRKGKVTERLYFNYTLTDRLHDYCYIGQDFREREAMNRVKKNLLKKLNRLDPKLRNAVLSDIISHYLAMTAGK